MGGRSCRQRAVQTRNGGIAERKAGRSGADQEGTAGEIGVHFRNFHVTVHVGLRSEDALEAVRISDAARMIAF